MSDPAQAMTQSTDSLPTEHGIVPSTLPFPVVGIGASAGGLQALQCLLGNMPAAHEMAFVVILHLSPRHPSSAAAILQRLTGMPLLQVGARVRIEPRHVYVIAPNMQLSMADGHLLVEQLQRPRGQHVAIDLFFRTLAQVHRERSIAIVLSGTGSDGAVGLGRVKEQGGVTIVQSPQDAEHDGMPGAAIRSGAADFVLPVAEMPQKLVDLWENARRIRLPAPLDAEAPMIDPVPPEEHAVTEQALHDIVASLLGRTGHDFRHYKRATVLRRIERRMQVCQCHTLPEYRALLEHDGDENKALLGDLLIGVTNFFRDREAFESLERDVIPELFKDHAPGQEVRAWVAACASGEEAYSLAMLLAEQAALTERPAPFQVFASDIDDAAIAAARAGAYPASIGADVAPTRLRQFFEREDNRYRVRKTLRERILFAAHNLLRDPPFSRLDLISCRNLLIYLNRDVQLRVLQTFHFALKPGGYLFLGASESAEALADYFTPVDKKHRIYRARAAGRQLHYQNPSSALYGVRLPAVSRPAPVARRSPTYAELHQQALAGLAPPSVLIDSEGKLVHVAEGASRYLRVENGEPTRSLLVLVLPELRLELRSALHQVAQNGGHVACRPVALGGDEPGPVAMSVRACRDEESSADFLLVLFGHAAPDAGDAAPGQAGGSEHVVLSQLEAELQRQRERLQETIESSEISTEELRASNEALRAINEELRSATEELETSKEELQSVNEELVTVNYELKVNVEETGKANDDLNNLIAATDIATIFVDNGLRIKRFTPRAADLFSIIASDAGRSLLDLTHKLDYDQLAADVGATFDTLRPVEREVRSNDGSYYIVRLLPYRTNDDRIEGAVMTFFDITARRKAEEQARASEASMRMVAESARDYAIITMDEEGRVTSWNKGAETLFGYSAGEMAGQDAGRLFVPEDVAAGVPQEELRRAREDGRAEDERWHLRKDGSRFFCSGVTTPLRNGELHGYAKIARDQTARERHGKEREQAFSRSQAERSDAQQAAALKDEFLAVMSHELRHPLNMIHINVELLARMPELRGSAGFMRAAAIIRSSVMSQAKIIDDLMDMSRVRTGKLSLSMAPVVLDDLLQGMVEMARNDPAAQDIAIELSGGADGLPVLADVVRIEQVVMNLLSNAIKFTPRGGRIEVHLAHEPEALRIDVIDNGQGIAPAFLPHVFDMYGQSMAVTTRTKGGLGIGLALVREIVALHGGRVEAASGGAGKGARFSLWLPLFDSQGGHPGGGAGAAADALTGLRILLVDDMEEMLQVFKSLLETSGASVTEATSAQQALAILEQQQVDLLISDISMPEVDGYEFLRRVRQLPRHARLPAIAITGMRREADIQRAREAGFSAHMGKPVSIERLNQIVHELLPRHAVDGAQDGKRD